MSLLLIIDDELEVCDSLQGFFQGKGFEVLVADTGQKGLELLLTRNPSLVLLDVRLTEGFSGIEVLRRAKAAKSESPILMVTAVEDRNVAQMAQGLGASGYITKPFQLSELEQVVATHLKVSKQ